MRAKKKRAYMHTIVVCLIMILFAQITESTGSGAFIYLSYGIGIAYALFGDSFQIFIMCVTLLSDNSILDIGGVSIQLVFMLIYIAKSIFSGKRFNKPTFVWALLIASYSLIYLNRGITVFLQGIKLAIMVLFLTTFFQNENITNEYEEIIRSASIGIISSILIAILLNRNILTLNRIALSDDSNWNLLGILAAILFSHCLMIGVQRTNAIFYAYAGILAICAIITTSRTALVALAFSVTWVILSFSKSKRSLWTKALILTGVAAVVILIITGTIHFTYTDQLINRIINPRRGDISNGRFTLWISYYRYLQSHLFTLLFGHGSAKIEGITTLTSSESMPAHNMYIEQLVMYGIVGNIIVISFYISSYKAIVSKRRNSIKRRAAYLVNILIVFVVGMFSHLLTSVLVTMELYLGILMYITYSSKNSAIKLVASDYEGKR